jgi:hypothetical protein
MSVFSEPREYFVLSAGCHGVPTPVVLICALIPAQRKLRASESVVAEWSDLLAVL